MIKSVVTPVVVTMAILVLISLVALVKLPTGAGIPMQWNLHGGVNWTAPKAVAVWFTPIIGLVVMGTFAYAASQNPVIAARLWPTAYVIGMVLIFAHGIHLWLAAKQIGS